MARDRRGVARIRRESQPYGTASVAELRRIDRNLDRPLTPNQELLRQAAGLTFTQLNRLRGCELDPKLSRARRCRGGGPPLTLEEFLAPNPFEGQEVGRVDTGPAGPGLP